MAFEGFGAVAQRRRQKWVRRSESDLSGKAKRGPLEEG